MQKTILNEHIYYITTDFENKILFVDGKRFGKFKKIHSISQSDSLLYVITETQAQINIFSVCKSKSNKTILTFISKIIPNSGVYMNINVGRNIYTINSNGKCFSKRRCECMVQ